MSSIINELSDYIESYAQSKNIKLEYDTKGIVNAYFKSEIIGTITYIISTDDITIYNLRTRDIDKEAEKCIHILDLDVNSNHREKKIGTLLIASVILIGYNAGCTHSILDDMSDGANHRIKNIYAKFGYTHKYVTKQPTHQTITSGPEKQLKLTSPILLLQLITKLLVITNHQCTFHY